MRLKGPMQSWGTRSRFDDRDTETEPSKSGVLGLLCAAAGIDRADWDSLEPLCRMKMGVRVDSAGVLRTDFQTAQLKPNSVKTATAITRKSYLADASFLVGLEAADRQLLERLHESLHNPYYPLSLGRKAFVPSEPIFLKDGVVEKTLEPALLDFDAAPFSSSFSEDSTRRQKMPQRILLVLESDFGEGSLRNDVPLAAFSERKYGPRYVRKEFFALKETAR